MKKTVYMAQGKIKLVTDVIGRATGTGLYESETISLKVCILFNCHLGYILF